MLHLGRQDKIPFVPLFVFIDEIVVKVLTTKLLICEDKDERNVCVCVWCVCVCVLDLGEGRQARRLFLDGRGGGGGGSARSPRKVPI